MIEPLKQNPNDSNIGKQIIRKERKTLKIENSSNNTDNVGIYLLNKATGTDMTAYIYEENHSEKLATWVGEIKTMYITVAPDRCKKNIRLWIPTLK